MKWQPISKQPPNKPLLVRDEFYNVAPAHPTYYDFIIVPDEFCRKWHSKVLPTESHWDGGWLIRASMDNLHPTKGRIKQWKEI